MSTRFSAIIIVVVMLAGLVVSACVPPGPTPEELAAIEKARIDSIRKANSRYCMKHLSFATEYYKNKNWSDALSNYKRLFDYMCVDEEMARDVYVFMGNCYRELGFADSAIMTYDEGLGMIPEYRYLWESKIFTLKTMDEDEAVIATKEEMLKQFPEDMALAEELLEDYVAWDRNEDGLALADEILAKAPDNTNVSNIKLQLYERMGLDPIEFLKKKYEDDPSDVPAGLDYAEELRKKGETVQAIGVLESILTNSPGLPRVMKDLVEAYKETSQTKKLISTLVQLNEIDPNDLNLFYDITEAYIADSQFETAMKWANQAIKKSPNTGRVYANRAAVYEGVANFCTGASADFDDKLVYMMAYEDYTKAKDLGYGRVNQKLQFMEEARIPEKGDWFFNKDDYVVKGKAAPKKDCYNWLNRSISAPKD
jgi:tetratricopeptide (TPR) repeat protein